MKAWSYFCGNIIGVLRKVAQLDGGAEALGQLLPARAFKKFQLVPQLFSAFSSK
jgi:hypothetical protein